jgi:hypothetical protein
VTLKIEKLELGHWHERIRHQQFFFEYKNPHQTKTMSAAAIIARHTEQKLSDIPITTIPPIMNRESTNKIQSNKFPEESKTQTNVIITTTATSTTTTTSTTA